jgi:hypothetical protein
MTDREIANALGVTPKTISQYRYQGCTGKTAEAVAQWRDEHKRRPGGYRGVLRWVYRRLNEIADVMANPRGDALHQLEGLIDSLRGL